MASSVNVSAIIDEGFAISNALGGAHHSNVLEKNTQYAKALANALDYLKGLASYKLLMQFSTRQLERLDSVVAEIGRRAGIIQMSASLAAAQAKNPAEAANILATTMILAIEVQEQAQKVRSMISAVILFKMYKQGKLDEFTVEEGDPSPIIERDQPERV